jgi:AcrR family transcriptional regulator
MTTTLRERRRQQLREEILEKAHQLITETGYAAMSMDDLAARIGISKPTLYAHFRTKDDMVVAAAVSDMQKMIELIEQHRPDQTPLDRLRMIMWEILKRQMQMLTLGVGPWPEVFRLLCNDPEALACLNEIGRRTTDLVQAAIAAGEIDPGLDPQGVVNALYGLASGLHKGQIANFAGDPERMAETLLTIFERGVRNPDKLTR